MAATTQDNSTAGSVGTPSDTFGTTTASFPSTRAQEATGEAPLKTAFPIGYVGVQWAGTAQADGGAIRVIDAGGAMGEWQAFGGSGCAEANGGALLIPVNQASGYELKAPDGAIGLRSLALDCTRGPGREVKVPTDPTRLRGVVYLSRAAWGADESLRFKPDGTENTPTAFYPFQTITLHHTATANADPDPAATVRGIYQFHAVTNDWGDIGYHFLIDEQGRIYEGRYSGDDVLPAHDRDRKLVTAFHVGGFNSGNLGIALLGTLTEQGPTDAARIALTRLVRVLTRLHGVDPKATVTYTNPVNGTRKEVPEISGHQDWMPTECPGATMYEALTRLREDVAGQG
ncbi:peptidoglycan recognition family protein [Streptomyces sp. WAC 01325]|uniref:peptidoglycan recognition protein family protein n=1 Tax=Streptomyces sp. WAC 01325 TaxID=2203202 RepID=UPI00163BB3C1|nr:N-acetylmuramoyl-L-alanine amidase [Streptomyces sp. WAC 01325]